MTVGGAIYNTLHHYSTSKHGDAEPKVNGFKFDPRRGKNRSLRGPVQTPLIVRAQVDGVVTKLRVPKGTTMEQIGGLVVGGCKVKRESDIQLRVEQVCWTEGRSSQKIAHRDYSRALLRVVQVVQARLPSTSSKTIGKRRMRTLNNAVYVPVPVAGVSKQWPCGALYPRLDKVEGVSPQRTVLEPTPELSPRTLERLGTSYRANNVYTCDPQKQRSLLESGPLELAAKALNLREKNAVWETQKPLVKDHARPLPDSRPVYPAQLEAARSLHAGIRRTSPHRGAQFDIARAIRVHHKADLRQDCPWRRLEGVDQKPFDYADAYRPLSDEVKRVAFADTEHEAASFADAGSQATPQDFGDDGSLNSVPRGGFISATPLGRGKREVRIPTDGASVTSFDTALSPDRQTSLVSGLETLSLEAPSVTFVGTKRRHVAGAMTNTHAVRMPRGAASPARSLGASDGLGPELSIDRFSHTGSDILSQEEGLGNLHNPSYSETGDLFVGNRWSGQGHDGGACGTLVGGGGYPTDVYRV